MGVYMKRFSETTRKWLRKFYLILGVAAISLLFQACYGMMMDDHYWDDWNWEEWEKNQTTETHKETLVE